MELLSQCERVSLRDRKTVIVARVFRVCKTVAIKPGWFASVYCLMSDEQIGVRQENVEGGGGAEEKRQWWVRDNSIAFQWLWSDGQRPMVIQLDVVP